MTAFNINLALGNITNKEAVAIVGISMVIATAYAYRTEIKMFFAGMYF